MGKKSRKKNKSGNTAVPSAVAGNTKLNVSVGATALALPSSCFHGSNLADFKNVDYIGAVQARFLMSSDITMIGKDNPLIASLRYQKFMDDYEHLRTLDADFCRFIFAYCTHLYQKCIHSSVKDMEDVYGLLSLGIDMRYIYQEEKGVNVVPGSDHSNKWKKYKRDIYSERGIIKCLARETPCNCMDVMKAEANGMDKTNICDGCRNHFPKTAVSNCTGCQIVKYCSKTCQVNHWPKHRELCKSEQKLIKDRIESNRIESNEIE